MTVDLLDKRGERIRGMFAAIAPRYDLLNHLLSLNIDRWWRQRTTRLAPPEGTGPILDLCTGTGDLALAYYRAGRGRVPIVGADFCRPMLRRAVQKGRRQAHGRIPFIEADAQNLPFPSDTFALVTVAFGLRNIADWQRGLAEMIRVTQPGGRIAVLEFSRPRHWLLGPLYRAYFRWLLPRVGQAISRSPDSAYEYLPASVLAFPDGGEFLDCLRSHGLIELRQHPFTFGIATLYVGRKPIERPSA